MLSPILWIVEINFHFNERRVSTYGVWIWEENWSNTESLN